MSIALRYLAGGSYLDIMYLHGVGRSAFYLHLWPTLAAIDAALPEFSLEADIYDLQRCRQLAAGFARKTDTHIRGAIAAIIFKVVKERPAVVNNEEVVNPRPAAANEEARWLLRGQLRGRRVAPGRGRRTNEDTQPHVAG